MESVETNATALPSFDASLLVSHSPQAEFAPGEKLRRKGQFYPDMYVLTEGEVEVALELPHAATLPNLTRRSDPIGEIGFLTGVRAVVVDDQAWRELERHHPTKAVQLYRNLAEVTDGRQSHDTPFLSEDAGGSRATAPIVVIRRSKSSAKKWSSALRCLRRWRAAIHYRLSAKNDFSRAAASSAAMPS
ncbi:MAG: hypothetical protein ACK4MF_00530 [Hyphomicrobiaceae bacterium]